MVERPAPPPPPRLSGEPQSDARSMEQWFASFYDNIVRGTQLADPDRQYTPSEFDPDNLPDPTDSSIANAQQTANEAFRRSADLIETATPYLVPTGAIIKFPKEPSNFGSGGNPGENPQNTQWLELDGGLYNVADFPALGAFLGATYGGDGIITFAVPNVYDTGRFLRSRTALVPEGTTQADTIKSHTHAAGTLAADSGGDHTHTTDTTGAHAHGGSVSGGTHTHSGTTDTQGLHGHQNVTGSGGSHTHSVVISDPGHAHIYNQGFLPQQTTQAGAGAPGGAQNSYATDSATTGITASTVAAGTHNHAIANDGAHSHTVTIPSGGSHTHAISSDGDHSHTISSSGAHTHTVSGDTATNGSDTETRPQALVVVVCIHV